MHKHRLWFTLRIKKGVLSRTNVRAELPLPLANIMMDGCDDHDLFLRKIRFHLFKKLLRHMLGILRNGLAILDQDLFLGRKGKMLKVDAVLLEQILGIVTPSFPVGEWLSSFQKAPPAHAWDPPQWLGHTRSGSLPWA